MLIAKQPQWSKNVAHRGILSHTLFQDIMKVLEIKIVYTRNFIKNCYNLDQSYIEKLSEF